MRAPDIVRFPGCIHMGPVAFFCRAPIVQFDESTELTRHALRRRKDFRTDIEPLDHVLTLAQQTIDNDLGDVLDLSRSGIVPWAHARKEASLSPFDTGCTPLLQCIELVNRAQLEDPPLDRNAICQNLCPTQFIPPCFIANSQSFIFS